MRVKYGDLKSPVKESNLPIFFLSGRLDYERVPRQLHFCDMFDPIFFIFFSEFLVQRFLVQ